MQAFHELSSDEKGQAFAAASEHLGMPAYVIEKDFHVTVVLECLFGPIWDVLTAENKHDPFIFKGGTTLSKVYGVIDRMSEDIDLALSMDYLGFSEPEKESNSQRENRRLPALQETAITFAGTTLLNALQDELSKVALGYIVQISKDADDALEVHYPKLCDEYDTGDYIKPRVLVETGGRAAQQPNSRHTVGPMVASVAQEADAQVEVTVLDISRTFFEKVTAVHAFIHQDKIEERSSRHLYDICQIFQKHPGLAADSEMLKAVCEHKKKYFRAGAAQYDKAAVGNVKLSPLKGSQVRSFKEDWAKMEDMFPSDRPGFDEILAGLTELEQLINTFNTISYEQIADLLDNQEPGYLLLSRLFHMLRACGVQQAHSISSKLVNLRQTHPQSEWKEHSKQILTGGLLHL